MSLIIEFFTWVVTDLIGEGLRRLIGRARREPLTENRIVSGLRAVDGRVYNIGTEWSFGTATLTPGHLSFVPSMGVVGNREIEIVAAPKGAPRRIGARLMNLDDAVVLTLDTPKGQLEWALDRRSAPAATGLLASGDTEMSTT